MINITEEWKPAKYCRDTGETEDWSHMLEVSNLGNVRYTEEYKSVHKKLQGDGPLIRKAGNKRYNYQYIEVHPEGKTTIRRLHRLVLSTFNPLHGNKKKKMDADHIDFDALNNKLYNLRWMDRSLSRARKKTTCNDYEFK